MMAIWLYKYILFREQFKALNDGWQVVGLGPFLGGWPSVIVRRRAPE
jgi:hypothetical protein